MKRAYSPFPGKPKVLAALRDAGTWTPSDVFRWARCNGGSEPTYEALHHYVQRGKVSYERNLWTFVRRYDPSDSQIVAA